MGFQGFNGQRNLHMLLAFELCGQASSLEPSVQLLFTEGSEANMHELLLPTRSEPYEVVHHKLGQLDLLSLDELGYVPASKAGAELLFPVSPLRRARRTA